MKKYLIAGVVAVVAFAMAGFAASLTVNGGVIQAGSDDDLTCTNAVSVKAYNTDGGLSYGIKFTSDSFTGCDDSVSVFASVYDDQGNQLAETDPNTATVGSGPSYKWRGNKKVDESKIDSVQVTLESN